jgi:hypothetical protein
MSRGEVWARGRVVRGSGSRCRVSSAAGR